RGVYASSDGGDRWQPVLQPGDSVGAVDLAWDERSPRVVYAATWQRQMHPWFDYFQPQVGPGSGIWRSDDVGLHWRRLTGDLPTTAGRIGIAVAPGSAGRIVYAAIAGAGGRGMSANDGGGGGLYRSNDGGARWKLVNSDASLGSSYFGRVTVAP